MSWMRNPSHRLGQLMLGVWVLWSMCGPSGDEQPSQERAYAAERTVSEEAAVERFDWTKADSITAFDDFVVRGVHAGR